TITTGKAAILLALHARKIHPKLLEVDWHSFLRENRRDPASNSAVTRRSPRGNSHIFGLIRHVPGGKKVLYSKKSLSEFVEKLRLKPELVKWLLRKVGE